MRKFVDAFLYRHNRYTRQDAEDLAQEIHIECFKGKARFRGEARFRTWLDKVALNVCVRFLSKERKDIVIYENEMGEVPFACLIQEEIRERKESLCRQLELSEELSRLLSLMTPRQRRIVCWKYLDGLSCRQIATNLGLREQSVRAALHYGLCALKIRRHDEYGSR